MPNELVHPFLLAEQRRKERRREELRRTRPSLFVDLDIVEIVSDPTSTGAMSLRDRLLPGSVVIAHSDAGDGTCQVDFEGGKYQRDPARCPTAEERDQYAKCAAGRAAERYPTVARCYRIARSDLRIIGRINPGEGRIEWLERA